VLAALRKLSTGGTYGADVSDKREGPGSTGSHEGTAQGGQVSVDVCQPVMDVSEARRQLRMAAVEAAELARMLLGANQQVEAAERVKQQLLVRGDESWGPGRGWAGFVS